MGLSELFITSIFFYWCWVIFCCPFDRYNIYFVSELTFFPSIIWAISNWQCVYVKYGLKLIRFKLNSVPIHLTMLILTSCHTLFYLNPNRISFLNIWASFLVALSYFGLSVLYTIKIKKINIKVQSMNPSY